MPATPIKAYLKHTCPYCLKFRIFATEAGLAERFEFVVFEDGDSTHTSLRERMKAAGQEPSFPAVETEPGKLLTGTDELISHFASEAGVDSSKLPLLDYYTGGVFKRHIAMFRELKELKSKSK